MRLHYSPNANECERMPPNTFVRVRVRWWFGRLLCSEPFAVVRAFSPQFALNSFWKPKWFEIFICGHKVSNTTESEMTAEYLSDWTSVFFFYCIAIRASVTEQERIVRKTVYSTVFVRSRSDYNVNAAFDASSTRTRSDDNTFYS
jgi:hypothetical protein